MDATSPEADADAANRAMKKREVDEVEPVRLWHDEGYDDHGGVHSEWKRVAAKYNSSVGFEVCRIVPLCDYNAATRTFQVAQLPYEPACAVPDLIAGRTVFGRQAFHDIGDAYTVGHQPRRSHRLAQRVA